MDQGSVPYWVATLLNYKHLKSTNPRSIDDMQVANLPESAMDQGSGPPDLPAEAMLFQPDPRSIREC